MSEHLDQDCFRTLKNICRRRYGPDGLDLLAGALTKAVLAEKKGELRATTKGELVEYLKCTMARDHISELRSARKKRTVAFAVGGFYDEMGGPPSPAPSPLEEAASRDLFEKLVEPMLLEEPKQRRAALRDLIFSELEEYNEIAAKHHVPVGTLKAWMARFRKKLTR